MYTSLALLVLLGTASAFLAPVQRIGSSKIAMANDDRSTALPFDRRPPNLDGTLPGDAGFDPAGFSNNPPRTYLYGGESRSLKWYREAELVHGRVAQLAIVGQLFPSWFHFPGNAAVGVPDSAFAEMNPYKALSTAPNEGILQIILAIFVVECFRIQRVILGEKEPGDLGLGQTGFNPFNFNYTPEQYFEKQVQETKHGRLAMLGALGMLIQTSKTGLSIPQQLGQAFSLPYDRAVLEGPGALNDFFPQGL